MQATEFWLPRPVLTACLDRLAGQGMCVWCYIEVVLPWVHPFWNDQPRVVSEFRSRPVDQGLFMECLLITWTLSYLWQ